MAHDGLKPAALAASAAPADTVARIEHRIGILGLDLDGLAVVTEAATGAYAVTAVIAAMAGAARVTALARDTARHGSARDALEATLGLARAAGVAERIRVVDHVPPGALAECDILTNSGHLRPIDAGMIATLPRRAVIGLMYEAWEFRGGDIDMDACRARGIRVAAVNECHPDVAVFPFLGPLAARLLREAGVGLEGARVALLCDNPFADFIRAGLVLAGARVEVFASPEAVTAGPRDVLLLALNPAANVPLGGETLARLARSAPGALLAQFWGDMERPVAGRLGLAVAPEVEPRPGHMGILLNALGDEPIVRLQTGGLKAAEIVRRGARIPEGGIAHVL